MRVRPAVAGDAEAIARIYNQGIEDRVATFETEHRSVEEVRATLAERDGRHPAVVVEREGRVVGFAWSFPYSSRACYAGVAEFSVYVAREARRGGAGRAALSGLIEASEAAGLWKLTSRVFPENEASRRLCRALGYVEVGVHRRHARLDGRWRDCVTVERLMGPAARD